MKKIYNLFKNLMIVLVLTLLSFTVQSQVTLPYHEPFNYPTGDSLPMHGWTGVNTGDQILITAGNLDYVGLANSTGKKIIFNGLGRDFQRTITSQATGTVYFSFVMQVTSLGSLDATGGYFTGIAADATIFGASIWTKKNTAGTEFHIGINPRTTAANTVWSTSSYPLNTPVFIVGSYELVSGTANDMVKLWINPSSFGGATPVASYSATNAGTDLTAIDRVFIRQDSDTETPFIEMDELRVGTTWADVTPAGSAAIPVTSITVTGAGGATTISTYHGTLQMSAAVLPVDATDQTVTWSVVNGTGSATINASGLLTAATDGNVTVRATANDGSNVYGELVVTLSNQSLVPVTNITVTGAAGATTITTASGTLQMSAAILPVNASDQTVTWSVANGTGSASINTSGLLTAITDGTVTVRATANDGSNVYGELVVTISNQIVPTSIVASGTGGVDTLTAVGQTLQMLASVLPAGAPTNVTWSITPTTGVATINASGLLTAVANGNVVVRATSVAAPSVFDDTTITVNIPAVVITPIYDIQYSTVAPYVSPKNGQTVTTTGIVTGIYPTKGYYIQDANGPWHGVYVYSNANTPVLGDSIVITGAVSEYNTLTEISGITSYSVIASGKPQPTPVAVTASNAKTEQYEGVLVKLSNVKVTYVAPSGWFRVDQGVNDTIQIGKIFYTMSPAPIVDKYYDITGVVSFAFGRYDVNPRQASDITDATGVNDNNKNISSIYPTITSNLTNINFGGYTEAKITIIATSGRVLKSISVKDASTSVDFTEFANGVYIIRVENNSNNSIANYRVVKM